MNTINLQKIIDDSKFSAKQIAIELFPGNQFPVPALKRILSGDGELDAKQISKLAALTGLTVMDIFSGSWKRTTKGAIHIFSSGEFRAELNPATWETKIFKENSLFHESIICARTTTISEYLSSLNEIVNN